MNEAQRNQLDKLLTELISAQSAVICASENEQIFDVPSLKAYRDDIRAQIVAFVKNLMKEEQER